VAALSGWARPWRAVACGLAGGCLCGRLVCGVRAACAAHSSPASGPMLLVARLPALTAGRSAARQPPARRPPPAPQVCPDSAKVQQNLGIVNRRLMDFPTALAHFRCGPVPALGLQRTPRRAAVVPCPPATSPATTRPSPLARCAQARGGHRAGVLRALLLGWPDADQHGPGAGGHGAAAARAGLQVRGERGAARAQPCVHGHAQQQPRRQRRRGGRSGGAACGRCGRDGRAVLLWQAGALRRAQLPHGCRHGGRGGGGGLRSAEACGASGAGR
jgi:hypothetical protein